MKRFVLALSAVALVSSAAFAGDIVRQKEVRYSDLNLSSNDGIAALHARLVSAADEVCADTKEATQPPFFAECRTKAMNHAITAVSQKFAQRVSDAQ